MVWSGSPELPLPSVIQAMTDRITHRGPDDQGIWSDDSLSLGHRRLSILDLTSAGHQPMLSPDGRYVLAFNGEIYTHQTIRDELADRVTFRSSSDTETLLHGLMHFGEELLPRLNGIFAFAFYDAQTHQLLIARDQFRNQAAILHAGWRPNGVCVRAEEPARSARLVTCNRSERDRQLSDVPLVTGRAHGV